MIRQITFLVVLGLLLIPSVGVSGASAAPICIITGSGADSGQSSSVKQSLNGIPAEPTPANFSIGDVDQVKTGPNHDPCPPAAGNTQTRNTASIGPNMWVLFLGLFVTGLIWYSFIVIWSWLASKKNKKSPPK